MIQTIQNTVHLPALITGHPFWDAVILYWFYSAAVGALEAPDSTSGKGYRWLYKFLHTIAGNLTSAFGSKIPGLPVAQVDDKK